MENKNKKEVNQAKMGTFPEWLRIAREKLGLSQAEFAKKMGVQVLTVKRWESKEIRFKTLHLVELSELLDEEIDSLIKNSDGNFPIGRYLSPQATKCFEKMKNLNEDMDKDSSYDFLCVYLQTLLEVLVILQKRSANKC